jgi:hypothetical protein
MLSRILFFLVLGLVGYLLFRSFTKPKKPDALDRSQNAPIDDMVACARCGVNIPKRDALAVTDGFACKDGEACAHAPKP